jgi:hypothetical protein
VARWLGVRDAIYHQMHTEFWNEELQGFVQTKNGKTLDAACLLAPLVPPIRAGYRRSGPLEEGLVDDSMVYRYRTEDGLIWSEGTTFQEGGIGHCCQSDEVLIGWYRSFRYPLFGCRHDQRSAAPPPEFPPNSVGGPYCNPRMQRDSLADESARGRPIGHPKHHKPSCFILWSKK